MLLFHVKYRSRLALHERKLQSVKSIVRDMKLDISEIRIIKNVSAPWTYKSFNCHDVCGDDFNGKDNWWVSSKYNKVDWI